MRDTISDSFPKTKKKLLPRMHILIPAVLVFILAAIFYFQPAFLLNKLKTKNNLSISINKNTSSANQTSPVAGLGGGTDQLADSQSLTTEVNSVSNDQLQSLQEELQSLENKLTKLNNTDKLNLSGGELSGTLEIQDTLTLNDTAKTESLIPKSDDSYDLGSEEKGFDNAYVHQLFGSSILTVGSNTTTHALSRNYDALISGNFEVDGDTFFDGQLVVAGNTYLDGDLDLGSKQIHSLLDPTSNQDAATKAYVDTQLGSAGYQNGGGIDLNLANAGLLNVGSINGILSSTELGFLNGVTSEIQTQFTNLDSGKQNSITAGTDAQYYRGDKTWQTLNQAAIAGLKIDSSPTFAGLTLSGILNMGNSLITNIGHVGTNFTSGGGLDLAGALEVSGLGTFLGNLDIAGALTVALDTILGGDLELSSGNLTVAGTSTLTGDVTVSGDFNSTGRLKSAPTIIDNFERNDNTWTFTNTASTALKTELFNGTYSGSPGSITYTGWTKMAPDSNLQTYKLTDGDCQDGNVTQESADGSGSDYCWRFVKNTSNAGSYGVYKTAGAYSLKKGGEYLMTISMKSATSTPIIIRNVGGVDTLYGLEQNPRYCSDATYMEQSDCVANSGTWVESTSTSGTPMGTSWQTYTIRFIAQGTEVSSFRIEFENAAPSGSEFVVDNLSIAPVAGKAVSRGRGLIDSSDFNVTAVNGFGVLGFQNSGNLAVTATKTGTWDFSQHHFSFWIWVNNADDTATFPLPDNAINLTMSDGINEAVAVPKIFITPQSHGFWQPVTIGRDAFTGNMTIDWSNITSIKFSVTPTAAKVAQILIDDLEAWKTFPFKMAIIQADDCGASDYNLLSPLLAQHGWKGVTACPTYVGVGGTGSYWTHKQNSGIMTPGQIRQLADSGWDVISHEHIHKEMNLLSDGEMEYAAKISQRVLQDLHSFKGSRFYSAPFGTANTITAPNIEILKKYYRMQTVTMGGDNYEQLLPLPAVEYYRIPRILLAGVTNQKIDTVIDELDAFHGVVVFYVHSLSSDADIQQMKYVLDSLATNNVKVITYSDLYDIVAPGMNTPEASTYQAESILNNTTGATYVFTSADDDRVSGADGSIYLKALNSGIVNFDLEAGNNARNITVHLPSCSGIGGTKYLIRVGTQDSAAYDCGGSQCVLTLSADGSDTIGTIVDTSLETTNEDVEIECNGVSKWNVTRDGTS